MISKTFYPLALSIFLSLMIILVSRVFLDEWSSLNPFYLTNWVASVLLLVMWLIICFANLNKCFGGAVQTFYKEIRAEIGKNRKLITFLFLFNQIINGSLFAVLACYDVSIKYENFLDVLCITILFLSCWEYFNYFSLFRKEILKKPPNFGRGVFASYFRGLFLLFEASVIVYQIITSIYFVLLSNENVSSKNSLNCYLKLLFVLYVFKIIGTSCQKYLKKLLICASFFALITYDWYVCVAMFSEHSEEENGKFFDFFILILIISHGFLVLSCVSLYKEWHNNRNRADNSQRNQMNQVFNHLVHRPRMLMFEQGNFNNEQIKLLKVEVYKKHEILDKILCSICTFDVVNGEEIIKIPCEHIFHHNCIVPWLQLHRNCPNCRRVLTISDKNEIVCEPENVILDLRI